MRRRVAFAGGAVGACMGKANTSVAELKERFEVLFPGKWVYLRGGHGIAMPLRLGIAEIDAVLPRGIMRRQITQWAGASSSGKTSLLRAAIANWCRNGLNVAYVDSEEKLLAADWIFVEWGLCDALPVQRAGHCHAPTIKHTTSSAVRESKHSACFWMIHPKCNEKQTNSKTSYANLWAVNELIRSGVFDVVVLDAGAKNYFSSKIIARFQSSLIGSKTALIVLMEEQAGRLRSRDKPIVSNAGGASALSGGVEFSGAADSLRFYWGDAMRCEPGLGGIATLVPPIMCVVSNEGFPTIVEVSLETCAPNRLFTHPEVPDRRAPKEKSGAG